MEKIWLNGEVMRMFEARISVEDRGFQFGDGVYEVIRIYNGAAFTLPEHIARLERSCEGIGLRGAFNAAALTTAIRDYVAASGLLDGMVYLQVTRGIAPRNHLFPEWAIPTVLFYTRALPALPPPGQTVGVKLATAEDERWKRCWIKAITLLPNVLAKNDAIARGADEAVFVENGIVSECSASNLLAVIGGKVVTHPVGPKVLPGITRQILAELAPRLGIPFVERPLQKGEAIKADELFITSTTRELNWVSHWDGQEIARSCGPITLRLHEAFAQRVRDETT